MGWGFDKGVESQSALYRTRSLQRNSDLNQLFMIRGEDFTLSCKYKGRERKLLFLLRDIGFSYLKFMQTELKIKYTHILTFSSAAAIKLNNDNFIATVTTLNYSISAWHNGTQKVCALHCATPYTSRRHLSHDTAGQLNSSTLYRKQSPLPWCKYADLRIEELVSIEYIY